jgi:phage/plasmid-like protein (TIGR03299 family)
MAHELSFINGVAEFAFLQGTPVWHGFGQMVPLDQANNIDAWLYQSNMGMWTIKSAPTLCYDDERGTVITLPSKKILYRSDTLAPLADVGVGYNVVQPREIVQFFEDLIHTMGFQMVTCGVLFGGRRFWAQADIGQDISILGQESVKGKLLIATSCDLSMKTRAQYTTTCVVCNNTLRMATASDKNYVEIAHGSKFDADGVKQALELQPDAMLRWKKLAEAMSSIKLERQKAELFFDCVFNGPLPQLENIDQFPATAEQLQGIQLKLAEERSSKHIERCLELWDGQGLGMELDCRHHTLWGAVNSVTEYIDHHRATRTMDARIDRAWFGDGASYKNTAWEQAVEML